MQTEAKTFVSLATDQRLDPIPGTSFVSTHLQFGLLCIHEAY